jgi:hypothetical protein
MSRKKLLILLAGSAAGLAAWLLFNPPGRFGWCRFAFTTYSGVPRLVSDLQIQPDGTVRKVDKTHDLPLESLAWLIESKPDALIISTGWEGKVRPDSRIQALKGFEVHILRTGQAVELFNRLKKGGKRVAIHLHSTC